MARLYELFVICFLTIGVVCSRAIDSSDSPGDYERTASLIIGSSAGLGADAHDKYPDAEHRVGDLLISPTAQQILQSAGSVVNKGEQDPASDSKDREDPSTLLRRIRSPQEYPPPPPNRPKRPPCLLKLCSLRLYR